jgi:hypothetical protein
MGKSESQGRKPLSAAEIAEKRGELTGAGVKPRTSRVPSALVTGNLTREIFGASRFGDTTLKRVATWCGSGSGSGSGSGTGSGTGTGSGSGWA